MLFSLCRMQRAECARSRTVQTTCRCSWQGEQLQSDFDEVSERRVLYSTCLKASEICLWRSDKLPCAQNFSHFEVTFLLLCHSLRMPKVKSLCIKSLLHQGLQAPNDSLHFSHQPGNPHTCVRILSLTKSHKM